MISMSEIKKLEEEIRELKETVKALVELEKTKLQAQNVTASPKEEIDREALEAELKQVHLGELVRFAIKRDLIPRFGSSKTIEE